jgi:hypothetical protein
MALRVLSAVLLAGLVTSTAACGSAHTPPVASAAAQAAAASVLAVSPCGHKGRAPAHYKHVVWILMENKPASAVTSRRSAPFMARLARQCGRATHYYAITHPSLPNYIALTSGSTHGISDDADPDAHHVAGPSIFSQTNGSWRALEESMPSACDRQNAGLYAVRHDPAVYYTSLAGSCPQHVVPLRGTPDLSARFTFITPNIRSDTHDTSVPVGDAWLASMMRAIVHTPQYRSGTTAVFVTWDEDDGSTGNRVALIAIAPTVRAGARDHARTGHYSLLRTTEELLGLPLLGNAAHAPSMRAAFHL